MPKKEYEFTDTVFMSANDKRITLANWRRFLEKSFTGYTFTKRLYNHLIQHCSFIAHYNKDGFWNHYFQTGRESSTRRFIAQFDEARYPLHLSAEMGADYWYTDKRYHDINSAMVEVMGEHANRLWAERNVQRREVIQAQLDRLNSELASMEQEG